MTEAQQRQHHHRALQKWIEQICSCKVPNKLSDVLPGRVGMQLCLGSQRAITRQRSLKEKDEEERGKKDACLDDVPEHARLNKRASCM